MLYVATKIKGLRGRQGGRQRHKDWERKTKGGKLLQHLF